MYLEISFYVWESTEGNDKAVKLNGLCVLHNRLASRLLTNLSAHLLHMRVAMLCDTDIVDRSSAP